MIVQLIMGFLAAFTFGAIFRIPRSEGVRCGMVGALGWIVFLLTKEWWGEIAAMFLAGTAVAVWSELLARRHHQPVVVFLTPGIIPLVPGGKAYLTMLSFLQKDYTEGVILLVTTVFLAGAVAAGIIATSSVFRIYSRTKQRGR